MKQIAKSCVHFFRKEAVLCIAVVLAAVSSIFVPPSAAYAEYIDWNTLALLFSLMAVMQGFQKAGLFISLANQLLRRTTTSRRMFFILVFLPFLFSMVVTNDVSLITFVPFGIIVLRIAKQEQLVVPLVTMQTVAANLGSMLTPMGNPQNLYLYSKFDLGFAQVCRFMLPYVIISGICLAIMIVVKKSVPINEVLLSVPLGSPKLLIYCTICFALCLLGVFKVIWPIAIAAATAIIFLVADKSLLAHVDYSLLGTFFALFIFIGNIERIEIFKNFLASVLTNHVELAAVLTSQVISNVPAALLLAKFTDQWQGLLLGCNIGGLGTLIASMASLISYKMVVKTYPHRRKHYLIWFTACNIVLLAVLLLADLVLKRLAQL